MRIHKGLPDLSLEVRSSLDDVGLLSQWPALLELLQRYYQVPDLAAQLPPPVLWVSMHTMQLTWGVPSTTGEETYRLSWFGYWRLMRERYTWPQAYWDGRPALSHLRRVPLEPVLTYRDSGVFRGEIHYGRIVCRHGVWAYQASA